MNILYIGDIMGEPGVQIVEKILPQLKIDESVDLTIAQAENVTAGRSMLPVDMKRLMKAGVDFFTGGNHTPKRKEIHELLKDNSQPVIGPANMDDCPGPGWKYAKTPQGNVLVISILGTTFKENPPKISNPLKKIDRILADNKGVNRSATVVNFHGDYSSEKRVFGYYLDGRVTAVIGDHWHVPTADAMLLPNGTAHITDVGMCGTLHSSIGIKLDTIIERWRDNTENTNAMETIGPFQFNAVLISSKNGKPNTAAAIKQISIIRH